MIYIARDMTGESYRMTARDGEHLRTTHFPDSTIQKPRSGLVETFNQDVSGVELHVDHIKRLETREGSLDGEKERKERNPASPVIRPLNSSYCLTFLYLLLLETIENYRKR